jgi:hypothetical protein
MNMHGKAIELYTVRIKGETAHQLAYEYAM